MRTFNLNKNLIDYRDLEKGNIRQDLILIKMIKI